MHVIISIALIASWLQPVHLPPWVSIYNEIPSLIGLVLSAFFMLYLRGDAKIIAPPRVIWGGFCLSVLLVVQYGLGAINYLGDLLIYLIYLQAVIFAYLLGFNTMQKKKLLFAIQNAALIAGLVTVVVLMIQALALDYAIEWVNPMPAYRRPGGNLAQANHAGTLLVMAMAAVWVKRSDQKIGRMCFALVMGTLLIGLAATESRTAFISSMVVTLWFVMCAPKSRKSSAIIDAGIIICIQVLVWCVWPKLFANFWLLKGGVVSNDFSGASGNLRFALWIQIIHAIYLHPWLGWGWGQISAALNTVSIHYSTSAPFTYSHNLALDLMIGFGVPVALIIIFLGLRFVVFCYRRKNLRTVAGAFGMILPMLCHSMLEFPHAYYYFLFPFFLLVGILAAQGAGGNHCLMSRKLVTSFVVVFSALLVQAGLEYVLVEEDYRQARFEVFKIGQVSSSYQPPNIYLLTQLAAMIRATRSVPARGMMLDEIDELRKVAERYPLVGFQGRYALALALNGRVVEAKRQLRVIEVMYGGAMYAATLARWPELSVL